MAIELEKDARAAAIASILRYAEAEFDEPLGNLQSGALLDFILAEIGPSIYNKAVKDVQDRLMARVSEVDAELYQVEFAHWPKSTRRGR